MNWLIRRRPNGIAELCRPDSDWWAMWHRKPHEFRERCYFPICMKIDIRKITFFFILNFKDLHFLISSSVSVKLFLISWVILFHVLGQLEEIPWNFEHIIHLQLKSNFFKKKFESNQNFLWTFSRSIPWFFK